MLILSGCNDKSDSMDGAENILSLEETVADTQAETIDEITESQSIKVENELPVIQPSDQFEDIVYDGDVKNLQDAVTGREDLFFYGYTENGENGIYIMKKGEATAVRSEAGWDEGKKRIRCMSVSESGDCYVLMVSVTEDCVDYKTMEIMTVAPDGKVIGTIDISDNIKGADWKMLPDGISIDREENIYVFSEADKYSVMVMNKDGETLGRLERESDRYIEGIGRGKDGAVYIVYSNADAYSVGMIAVNGELTNIHENVLSGSEGKYKYIGSGTDSNLLIYGKAGSIYAYTDEEEAEERIAGSNLVFDAYKVKVLGFLADGRMAVSYLDDENMRHFLYVPTVR